MRSTSVGRDAACFSVSRLGARDEVGFTSLARSCASRETRVVVRYATTPARASAPVPARHAVPLRGAWAAACASPSAHASAPLGLGLRFRFGFCSRFGRAWASGLLLTLLLRLGVRASARLRARAAARGPLLLALEILLTLGLALGLLIALWLRLRLGLLLPLQFWLELQLPLGPLPPLELGLLLLLQPAPLPSPPYPLSNTAYATAFPSTRPVHASPSGACSPRGSFTTTRGAALAAARSSAGVMGSRAATSRKRP